MNSRQRRNRRRLIAHKSKLADINNARWLSPRMKNKRGRNMVGREAIGYHNARNIVVKALKQASKAKTRAYMEKNLTIASHYIRKNPGLYSELILK